MISHISDVIAVRTMKDDVIIPPQNWVITGFDGTTTASQVNLIWQTPGAATTAVVKVGLSADDVKSHKDFCNKFSFTIDLLADPSQSLLKAAGVGQSEWKGTMYWDRTTFVIAHRLSTVRHAQRIIVLTDQGVEEQGTHDELIARGGTYANLYNLQLEL